MEEIEYMQTSINEQMAKAQNMYKYATTYTEKGKILEACNNAMKTIQDMEAELGKMSTKSN